MGSPSVDLLLATLDHLLESGSRAENENLARALTERTSKILAPVEYRGIASASAAVEDPLRTEPCRAVAAYLHVCEETVRRLCRDETLQVVRKGTGRNYEVLWASVVEYRRRMVTGGDRGKSDLRPEARTLAPKVARYRK